MNLGVSTAIINFENSWKARTDPNWKKNLTYVKLTNLEYSQMKTYKSDGMNNNGKNLHINKSKGDSDYPEIISYWNFYHDDEQI